MVPAGAELAAEVEGRLAQAEGTDPAEDAALGADRRGDEMPVWMRDKQRRLEHIRAAKAELEAERGPPKLPGRTWGARRTARLAGAAVDATAQVILARHLTNNAADQGALAPLLDALTANTQTTPAKVSADSGYCSEANLADLAGRGIRSYVATGVLGQRMRLRRAGRRSRYRLRKQVVEPVFGQIKGARGFRQFLLRGIGKAKHEWAMICTAHNLTKLARAATR